MATTADYKIGTNVFPRGWFIVAEASELGEKGTLAVSFFGQDLAVFRGESGQAVVLDAYCPHMGTHLTASNSASIVTTGQQIEGDSIRCPYHGWRFNSAGECDDIPYFDGPCPKAASVKSWPVRESMGILFVWHDQDNQPPEYEPPFLEEWNNPSWVQWQLDHIGQLDIHQLEVLDNMADAHHLGPTHGAPCEYFENEFKDHVYIQRQGGFHEVYQAMLTTATWYTGPGILLSKQLFGETLVYELIANTPVADGRCQFWHGVLYKTNNEVANDEDKEIAKQVQAGALAVFSSDFEIWKNKKPAFNILQVPTEGSFPKGRTWLRQFYNSTQEAQAIRAKLNGCYHIKGMEQPNEEARALDADLFN